MDFSVESFGYKMRTMRLIESCLFKIVNGSSSNASYSTHHDLEKSIVFYIYVLFIFCNLLAVYLKIRERRQRPSHRFPTLPPAVYPWPAGAGVAVCALAIAGDAALGPIKGAESSMLAGKELATPVVTVLMLVEVAVMNEVTVVTGVFRGAASVFAELEGAFVCAALHPAVTVTVCWAESCC